MTSTGYTKDMGIAGDRPAGRSPNPDFCSDGTRCKTARPDITDTRQGIYCFRGEYN